MFCVIIEMGIVGCVCEGKTNEDDDIRATTTRKVFLETPSEFHISTLNGRWLSKNSGKIACMIRDGLVTWPAGTEFDSRLVINPKNQIEMVLDGEKYTAFLNDGALHWNDDDVWTYIDSLDSPP